MEIYISEEDILGNIQDRFQEVYPYLKLEFFLYPHPVQGPSDLGARVSPETPVEVIRMVHSFGWVDIGDNRTVEEVETDFCRDLGLYVQVFRRTRTGWLETARTDDLTLGEQNAMGKENVETEMSVIPAE
ncbi:MAG TPA: hypothetical protein VJ720_10070 [Chitinophaga sp.]|nr:hypothetical protein [Chitinophaga sp.]